MHTHTHTRTQSRMHVQKHPNAQIHTHLHTIMLSQHTVAGYICARANSKQLWSSYQNRSPKTPSVQLLCTKSFISLDPSHTINHGRYSVIVMYIFLWSRLTILDWIHYANTFRQKCWWSLRLCSLSLSLCCVYAVVIVFLNQIFRVTDCCLCVWLCVSACLCVRTWGKKGDTRADFGYGTFSIIYQTNSSQGSSFWFSRASPQQSHQVMRMLLWNVLTVFVWGNYLKVLSRVLRM